MSDFTSQTENKNSPQNFLSFIFWTIALVAVGLVAWKLLNDQDQPMENKILFVFSAFIICAVLFRWIAKKAAGTRLRAWTAEAIEWSDTGVSAVLLAFVIMSFVMQAFKIPSASMQSTLLIGDHLFVNKFIYGTQVPFTLNRLWDFKPIERGDVIVFLCPPQALSEQDRTENVKKDYIKRAVALAGDTVEFRDKKLYVNGQSVDDPHAEWASSEIFPRGDFKIDENQYQDQWNRGQFVSLPIESFRDNFGPVTVPKGCVFAAGDNRDGSYDSRFWGPLDRKYIKGKAWLVYWPINRVKMIR